MKRKIEHSRSAIAVPGLFAVISCAMILCAPLLGKDQAGDGYQIFWEKFGLKILENPGALSDRAAILADLAAVQQQMIEDHACHHCFANGYCANANARIVTTFGDDLGFLA